MDMSTLRRKALALSIVSAAGISLILLYLTFQPWTTSDMHSFMGGHQYLDKLVGNLPINSTTVTTHVGSHTESETHKFRKTLVVGKTTEENTSWVEDNFSDWQIAVYTVDDENATLHTAQNKGHEASVYLTYIIDNYSDLPNIMVFLHSHQKHKHGTRKTRIFEGIDYDNVKAVKTLRLTHVEKVGYANLRCLTRPGCPAEIQPFRPEEERDPLRPQEAAMAKTWGELFGEVEVPSVIAAPCCAQFAVSKSQVLERPKEEYENYLNWIYDTPLDDFTSGRIFEYLWHIIFGKDPVYCPDMDQCYQDQYGRNASVVHAESNNTIHFSGG